MTTRRSFLAALGALAAWPWRKKDEPRVSHIGLYQSVDGHSVHYIKDRLYFVSNSGVHYWNGKSFWTERA